jgi:hypothetical protein
LLNRLLHNPHETPTLRLAVRPAFGNFNYIARTSLIMLIMNTDFCPAPDEFTVFRMPNLKINGNLDALVTTFACHQAGHYFRFSILHFDSKSLLHFPHYCFDSGNITPDIDYGLGIFQLFRNRLRTQVKQMSLEFLEFTLELIRVHLAVMLYFHFKRPVYSECLRLTNLHLIGILCATLTNACFATLSLTPPISNITVPGLTLATQNSGSPLPLPIRVSSGLLLTGLCGNILR